MINENCCKHFFNMTVTCGDELLVLGKIKKYKIDSDKDPNFLIVWNAFSPGNILFAKLQFRATGTTKNAWAALN